MKYLFLIVRHFFPRKRWVIKEEIELYYRGSSGRPCGKKYVLRDQFGNLKFRTSAQ